MGQRQQIGEKVFHPLSDVPTSGQAPHALGGLPLNLCPDLLTAKPNPANKTTVVPKLIRREAHPLFTAIAPRPLYISMTRLPWRRSQKPVHRCERATRPTCVRCIRRAQEHVCGPQAPVTWHSGASVFGVGALPEGQ